MVMRRLSAFLRGDDFGRQSLPAIEAPAFHVRALGDQVIRWQADKPQWLPHDVATYDREGYRKAAIIHACVKYLANAAGAAPLRVYQDTGTGQPREDKAHRLRYLLQQPNDRMGEARFFAFVTMVAAVTGICVIEKERSRGGEVIGLWPLRTDWLRPIPRNDAPPDWEYRIPGDREGPRFLKAEDAIPVPWADTPDGDVMGISPLQVLMQQIGINNSLTGFVKTFLDRGAMPLYFALPDTEGPLAQQWADPAKVEAFRAKFRQTRGEDNVLLSPAIKDIKPLGFNFNELAYTDLRKFTEADICAAFGIPPILVGAQVGLDRSTYSNTKEARRAFYEDTMTYWWSRLDDAVTRHLMPEFEWRPQYSLQFDVSDVPALQDDENAAWQRANTGWASGMISRHAAQREAGIEPHGEDVFILPFSATVVPVAGAGETPTPTPTDETPDESDQTVPGDDEGERSRALPAPRTVTRDGRVYLNERALSPAQRAATERVVTHHRGQIVRLADLIAPAVQRFFRGQRDRLVDALVGERAGRPAIETRAIETFDWAAEDDALREIFRQWWESVSEVAFADASSVVGSEIVWSISNPYLADLFDVLGRRITGINETTRQAVETIVRESLITGTTIPELADNLRDVFDETFAGRHLTVSRTESQVAFNLSTQRAYQASGVVSRVVLHDNPKHDTDPGGDGLTCSQRNSLIVPLADMHRHSLGTHPNCILAVSASVEA